MATIRDKMGVCIQPDTTGPMQQIDKAIAAIRHLGLDTVRIRAPIVGSDSYNRIYKPLANAGLRFLFTHAPGKDPANEVAALATIDAIRRGCVIGYEGPNEPDLNPVTFNGVTDVRRTNGVPYPPPQAAIALMQAQRNALRANLAFANTRVVAFNDWYQVEQRNFTSTSNSHIYPTTGKTLASYESYINALARNQGSGKIVVSELGYTNGTGSAFNEVSEAHQAANITTDIIYAMGRAEIERAYIYDLVDGPTTSEGDRFGLFRHDWTPKPAADAIYNLTT